MTFLSFNVHHLLTFPLFFLLKIISFLYLSLTQLLQQPISFQASVADSVVFDAVKKAPDAEKYPHAARWFTHITAVGKSAYVLEVINYQSQLLYTIYTNYYVIISINSVSPVPRKPLKPTAPPKLLPPLPPKKKMMMTLTFSDLMMKKMPKPKN